MIRFFYFIYRIVNKYTFYYTKKGSIINVVVLMKIKTATFIFLHTKRHGKFLVKYQSTKTDIRRDCHVQYEFYHIDYEFTRKQLKTYSRAYISAHFTRSHAHLPSLPNSNFKNSRLQKPANQNITSNQYRVFFYLP